MKDENGEPYTTTDMSAPSYSPTLIYKYKGYEAPKNGWRVNLAKMKELDSEGRLVFGDHTIRRKNLLKDRKGVPLTNIWLDIGCLQGNSDEKTKWPTQKPVALLERILEMSSNEGDLVFDCFAGCGTTMHAAHKLKRKWVGVDISKTAMKVNSDRLEKIGARVTVVHEDDLDVVPVSKNTKRAA
jgi:DNA modification methylase